MKGDHKKSLILGQQDGGRTLNEPEVRKQGWSV